MTDINQLEIKQLERAADVLRAVAHPIRLQIIQLLSQKEITRPSAPDNQAHHSN